MILNDGSSRYQALPTEKSTVRVGRHFSPSDPILDRAARTFQRAQDISRSVLSSSTLEASNAVPLAVRAMHTLLPSFLQPSRRREQKQERIHPTAYLDGMRGLAAFAVFICHLSYQFFIITYGYGAVSPGLNDYLIQLPIVKLFYSGPPMVAIFFVISGYALSYKPLRQMRARQWDALMHTLSSSVFRRPVRLFLPCIASTLIVFAMLRVGVYDYTNKFSEDKSLLRGAHEEHILAKDTFTEQSYHWISEIFDFIHPWDFGIYSGSVSYDRHLWTIPTEFRASMVLFLSLFMTARMPSSLRMLTFSALIYWALLWDRWEMILFWAGPLLAESDLNRAAHRAKEHNIVPSSTSGNQLPSYTSSSLNERHGGRLHWWFYMLNFLCGLYVASYPDAAGGETPGYVYMTSLIPDHYSEKIRFWQSIGAIQIVWAVNNMDVLKSLFTGPVVQYLGKLSYALYLMHGPVLHSFGYIVMPIVWGVTGYDTRWNFEIGFLINAVLVTIATIWVSDVFWRLIDVPIVNFGRWLEGKCIVLP